MQLARPRRRRASSAVEFALLAPLAFSLVFGIMDLTWCMMAWRTVISSAQVGARAGARIPLSDSPDRVAERQAQNALEATWPLFAPPSATYEGSIVSGNIVRIDVTVDFIPLVGFVSTPDTLGSFHQMQVEIE
jgi:Flp pilus assembly protein TadG